MAERKRTFADRLLGRNKPADPDDVSRLTKLINDQHKPELDWDGKALASMSRIGAATSVSRGKTGSGGTNTQVSYNLLRDISLKSEVVNAILRRCVDDILGNGYSFRLADGKEQGNPEQLNKLKAFFTNPNPDDNGNEWMESLIYDLCLFGDAYLELDGSEDTSIGGKGTSWVFGGELVSVWPIPAEQMTLLAGNRRPEPPKMAYMQKLYGETRKFSKDKIIHISKFKHGRAYGTSPLIPLLNVIAGHLNLSNYLNELYTGTLPKTILNVGDISNAEMKAMLALLEQQLTGGKSPFGLVAVNGGTGFNMHRILDSTREGAQLDLLYYYREEICAVFGIPPMKLGWVQTGKMSNPEQQLDAWYDVIESYHKRIEAVFNNRLMPLLDITDWRFKFTTIRPSRDKEIAETRAKESTAISNLRQEGVISINEARNMLGLERLEIMEADDPMFLSPKLSINKGKVEAGGEVSSDIVAVSSLAELFPPPASPSDEGKGAGEHPDWLDVIPTPDLSDDIRADMTKRRLKNADEFEEIIAESEVILNAVFTEGQEKFASDVISELNEMFADGDEAIQIPDVDLKVNCSVHGHHEVPMKSYRRKEILDLSDIELAVGRIDANIALAVESQAAAAQLTLVSAYESSMATTLAPTGISAALMADDVAAIGFWQRRWVLPALRNTLGSHRDLLIGVFERMVSDGESWRWARNEMRQLIDPSGSRYPAYFYERISRTETRRVVEHSHISGMRRAGFQFVQRLVGVDETTDRDLCAPYEDAVYPIDESKSVIPAHPNCRCTFTAYEGTPDSGEVVPPEEIFTPVIEFNIKAEQGSVSNGDFVSWSTDKGGYVGKVESVRVSGSISVASPEGGSETIEASDTNQVAIVRVYIDNEDGTYSRSDRTVPVRVAMLRKRGEPELKDVSATVRKTLSEKAKEHNEKVGDAKTKRTTTRTLVAVFERGVGAYQTNPQSVRPTVNSAEQWAYARVNSFLYALRNGRFRGGKHDQDLLPKGHPQSTKSLKRALTTADLTPPAGVRTACRTGINLFEEGFGGSGLEAATIREARGMARGDPITEAKARKMIRWWGRNERFLDEPKDSPAWTAAMLWGGRAGLSWSRKLKRAIDAEE